MLKNMFVIAWRNAIRHKQFSLLNILGLSIGITATLVISLYVINQYSYDNFFSKGDRVYRINQPMIWGDWNESFASTGPNLAVALRSDVPEFEEVTRVHTPGEMVINYQPEGQQPVSFTESTAYVAEQNFFQLFDFPKLEGNLETALELPGSVVVTEETAIKYFGTNRAIGKTLVVNQSGENKSFQVTAVLEDIPTNSHIQFNMLLSMTSFDHIRQRQHQWIWTTFVTYGLVGPDVNVAALEDKIQSIPPKWATQEIENVFGQTYDEYVKDKQWTLELQPISEVYVKSPPSGNRIGPAGNILYVQIFSAVGVLILVLCSINFMNLSTAKSANRAKEVGIRKVLGSEKSSLIRQFIFESVLYVACGTILAIVITEVSLDAFNLIADTELSLHPYLSDPQAMGLVLTFILVLGVAAGSYPAFYLSSFSPVKVLKGKLSSGFKGSMLRNVLIITQFTISVALIVSTFFVQKQLNYVSKVDLGFNNQNVLQIHNMEMLSSEQQETLQTLLKNNPAIEQVGISDMTPPAVFNEDKYKAFGPETEAITLNRIRCNEEYVDMLGVNILEGRNFDETRGTDRYKILLNVSAIKALGWEYPASPENSPIGKHITFPNSTQALFEVIGVMEDFNFNSVRYDIVPLMIIHNDNDKMWNINKNYLSVRLNPQQVNTKAALEANLSDIKAEINEFNANIPFEYSFMDQLFEASFRTEQRMGQILNIFTVMALVIACLGLFGLSAFASEQRKKELGIRKVLGASAQQLIAAFTREFSILILIAILIASPLAYWFVKGWLSDFAYKTPLNIWVFVAVGCMSFVIAWLTIGFHSLNSARQNPAEILRDE